MYCTSCLSDIYWYLFVSPIHSIAVKYHKHFKFTFHNASVQQSQSQEQYLLSSVQTQNHIKHFKLIVNWVQLWRPSLQCWGWQMMRRQRRFWSGEFCCKLLKLTIFCKCCSKLLFSTFVNHYSAKSFLANCGSTKYFGKLLFRTMFLQIIIVKLFCLLSILFCKLSFQSSSRQVLSVKVVKW